MPLRTSRDSRFKSTRAALLLTGVVVAAFTLPVDLQAADNRPQPALKACECLCIAKGAAGWIGHHTEFVLQGESCPASGTESCSKLVEGKWEEGKVSGCLDKSSETQSRPRKPPKKRSPWTRKTSEAPPRSPGGDP